MMMVMAMAMAMAQEPRLVAIDQLALSGGSVGGGRGYLAHLALAKSAAAAAAASASTEAEQQQRQVKLTRRTTRRHQLSVAFELHKATVWLQVRLSREREKREREQRERASEK